MEAMLAADEQEDLLMDRPAYQAAGALVPSMPGPDDSQSFSGEMIGDYRLIKELGRGGMGTVYLAYDTRLGRQAALKLLPSGFQQPGARAPARTRSPRRQRAEPSAHYHHL